MRILGVFGSVDAVGFKKEPSHVAHVSIHGGRKLTSNSFKAIAEGVAVWDTSCS